jgi:hypothetical protein
LNWKAHYSELETLSSTEEFHPTLEPVNMTEGNPHGMKKSRHKKSVLSKKTLALIAGLAHNFTRLQLLRNEEEQDEKRAKDIRVVVPKPDNPRSLSSLIYSVIQKSEKPVHITNIISQVSALGYKSKSEYHVYSRFEHALAQNYDVFQKQGHGLYSIRSRSVPSKAEIKAEEKTNTTVPIATLKDIIATVAKDYATPDGTSTPARVHYVLTQMGLRCAYSSVYRTMQSSPFLREGINYRVQ